MLRILYRSEAVVPFGDAALAELSALSARRNAARGIGGFLVERSGVFVQLIEGPEDAVDGLFGRILRDPRHRDVEVLVREAVPDGLRRAGWAMNVGRLGNPLFWRAVLGPGMSEGEFRDRSRDPGFAFDLVIRAQSHADVVAEAEAGPPGDG